MPSLNQNPNSSPVDQVAEALVVTLKAELPEDVPAVPASRAASFVIATKDDRSVCSALLGDTKAKFKALDDRRLARVRPLLEAQRLINADYEPGLTYLKGEKAIYESILSEYDESQRIIREDEARKQREETERIRQAEIAEAQEAERVEREKAAQMRRAAQDEQDAIKREQMQLEAAEREQVAREESAQRQEQAAMISTPSAAPAVSHVGGESQSWKYSAECLDLKTAVKAVAEGRLPLSCLEFSTVGSNKLANALQEEFRAQYPEAICGVRLVKSPVYTHRQKRR